MTEATNAISQMLIDKARALGEHDGVPHGIPHLFAAAEHFVAEIRRELDNLVAHFAPHGAPASPPAAPPVEPGAGDTAAVQPPVEPGAETAA